MIIVINMYIYIYMGALRHHGAHEGEAVGHHADEHRLPSGSTIYIYIYIHIFITIIIIIIIIISSLGFRV